jgi:hypothetical protein
MPSAVADALLPAPVNPAQPPRGFWGNAGRFAYDALGLGEAAKALRGQMTPTEAQDFAFGAALGLIPMSRGLKPVHKGIRAYHGSPHDFDRFDMSKIGTGEGAQAYGHGLYFAENPNVARQYREALAGTPKVNFGDSEYAFAEAQKALGAHQAANPLGSYLDGIRRDVMLRAGRSVVDDAGQGISSPAYIKQLVAEYPEAVRPQVSQWANEAVGIVKPHLNVKAPGKMYEVNINAHPDQFLDWDKPLSKQPQETNQVLESVFKKKYPSLDLRGNEATFYQSIGVRPGDPAAADVYYGLKHALGDPGAASNAFREAGIPGIKYLDQGSRTAGEGSRNYVVFDDKLIDIIKKYGLAALGLPPAMTAGNQIWNSQTQQ